MEQLRSLCSAEIGADLSFLTMFARLMGPPGGGWLEANGTPSGPRSIADHALTTGRGATYSSEAARPKVCSLFFRRAPNPRRPRSQEERDSQSPLIPSK